MNIDIGAPSKFHVSGTHKRISKMNAILPIPKGFNLDLGTGIGAYYSELNEKSKTLFAFDGEISFLKSFSRNLPIYSKKIFLAKSEQIPLKKDLFDAIIAIEVLEHVTNLEKTIQEIFRILKPNGFLYLSVPNKFFPLETHMLKFKSFSIKGKYIPFLSMSNAIHNKIGTARRFSSNDIKEVFEKNNFKLIGIDFMMPPFDYFKFGRKFFKNITERLERSRLKHFSMTIIAVVKKNN